MADDDLTRRFAALEDHVTDLRHRLAELEAENGRLRAPSLPDAEPTSVMEPPTAEGPSGLGRRRLLVGGATAGVAAVAGVVATGSPAAADDGQTLLMGRDNTATLETKITYSGTANNGFRVQGGSALAMIEGYQSGAGAGVKGANTAAGPGVLGIASSGDAVRGESQTGNAVKGIASGDAYGVVGESALGVGVYGATTTSGGGVGVRGYSGGGVGVSAESGRGTGLVAFGLTNLRLAPASGRTPPTGDDIAHSAGDFVIDRDGAVWLCISFGTPGTWRKIGGPATSGQLHVLPAPARVYDSRPGTSPTSVGPKTRFAANETRTFDLKVNGSTVPAGATAALVTILLVNASTAAGNATIWANGLTKPLANTMVWGGTAGRFTATTTTALDAQARIQFNASQPTDLVLDVVGYYR